MSNQILISGTFQEGQNQEIFSWFIPTKCGIACIVSIRKNHSSTNPQKNTQTDLLYQVFAASQAVKHLLLPNPGYRGFRLSRLKPLWRLAWKGAKSVLPEGVRMYTGLPLTVQLQRVSSLVQLAGARNWRFSLPAHIRYRYVQDPT